jgi:hypothetical protein
MKMCNGNRLRPKSKPRAAFAQYARSKRGQGFPGKQKRRGEFCHPPRQLYPQEERGIQMWLSIDDSFLVHQCTWVEQAFMMQQRTCGEIESSIEEDDQFGWPILNLRIETYGQIRPSPPRNTHTRLLPDLSYPALQLVLENSR